MFYFALTVCQVLRGQHITAFESFIFGSEFGFVLSIGFCFWANYLPSLFLIFYYLKSGFNKCACSSGRDDS